MRRTVSGVGICLLPLLAGLWVAATEFGGRLVPWRPVMVDLEVYRQAARVLLAVVLVRDLRPAGAVRRLPVGFGVLGLLFCGWVAVEPFGNLPNGGDLELTWTAGQNLLASVTLLLGVAFLVTAVAVALRRGPGHQAMTADPVEQHRPDLAPPAPVREVRP